MDLVYGLVASYGQF